MLSDKIIIAVTVLIFILTAINDIDINNNKVVYF